MVQTAPALAGSPAPAAPTWNHEVNDVLGQVISTQKDVAVLLQAQAQATSELAALKASAEAELADLQAGAWQLELFAELGRLRGQLEQLPSTEAGDGATPDQDIAALDEQLEELDRQLLAAKRDMKDVQELTLALVGELQQVTVLQQEAAAAEDGGDPGVMAAAHGSDVHADNAARAGSCSGRAASGD